MAKTDEKVDKTAELLKKIEDGVLKSMTSENYIAFLKFQSQLHNYSFNNQMLIFMQKPNASIVAGFKAWEKFERHVVKGEKGISILAPNPYKYTKEVEKIDIAGKPVIDPKTGKIQKEKMEMQGLKFRKVTVFDVSQTAGKELPQICKELQGNSVNSEKVIKAIKEISEIPVIEKNIGDGAKGYYNRSEGLIVVQKGMSQDQTAKTLIHEYAHSKLHNTEVAASLDRATKEVQAESTAYIVSNHFGIDTSNYTFDYLASWSSGKELNELKDSFNLIQKTANETIGKIEEALNKQLELSKDQVNDGKITILLTESGDLKEGQAFTVKEANEVLNKLDKEQAELRKQNEKYDYSKMTAGDKSPYVPYLKTKIKIELPNGKIGQCRFDLGESGYKNLWDCIRKECGLDISKYIDITSKEKIVTMYSEKFPPIKYISDKTAEVIDKLNTSNSKTFSIADIRKMHEQIGKKLEEGNKEISSSLKSTFKELSEVMDDIKHAGMESKQEQAKERAMQTEKSKSMEMVQ